MAELRAEDLAEYLRGASYPTDGPSLARVAEGNLVRPDLVDALVTLGQIRSFDEALSGLRDLLEIEG